LKKAILINDTSNELHHGCQIVIDNIESHLLKRGIKVVARSWAGHSWQRPELLELMPQTDLVLVNGEGTLHHGQPRAEQLSLVAPHARRLGLPAVLFNSTYQDNNQEINARIKDFDLVYVRESKSRDQLKSVGIGSEVVPDLTLANHTPNRKLVLPELVGFSDSVLNEVSEELFRASQQGPHKTFLPISKPYQVHRPMNCRQLIGWPKWHLKTSLVRLGRTMGLKDFSYSDLRRLYLIKSTAEYLQRISALKLLITGRFHCLCFAVSQMTPFAIIPSNTFKMESMLSDVGTDPKRIKTLDFLKNLSAKELSAVDHFEDWELDHLEKYRKSAVEKIENMFDEIKSLCQ
jgi:hypothetical protein